LNGHKHDENRTYDECGESRQVRGDVAIALAQRSSNGAVYHFSGHSLAAIENSKTIQLILADFSISRGGRISVRDVPSMSEADNLTSSALKK
jgi:hypothetical protein